MSIRWFKDLAPSKCSGDRRVLLMLLPAPHLCCNLSCPCFLLFATLPPLPFGPSLRPVATRPLTPPPHLPTSSPPPPRRRPSTTPTVGAAGIRGLRVPWGARPPGDGQPGAAAAALQRGHSLGGHRGAPLRGPGQARTAAQEVPQDRGHVSAAGGRRVGGGHRGPPRPRGTR